jgi:hypothetical protein
MINLLKIPPSTILLNIRGLRPTWSLNDPKYLLKTKALSPLMKVEVTTTRVASDVASYLPPITNSTFATVGRNVRAKATIYMKNEKYKVSRDLEKGWYASKTALISSTTGASVAPALSSLAMNRCS